MLLDLPSVETPIRYFGGKTRARRVLSTFIPNVVRDVLSPFIGGGSLELYLTCRGKRVYGYDAFPPLVNVWQVLLESPKRLCAEVRRIASTLEEERWAADASEFVRQHSGCRITDAAQCLIVYNLTFNNAGLRDARNAPFFVDAEGHIRRNQDGFRNRRLILYERIENFSNPLLSVGCLDFREAFARHPHMFAYCDPPYPAVGGVYGDSPEYHEAFDHEALAMILKSRTAWVLSYNDTELVRDLYPETHYRWSHVKWKLLAKKYDYQGNDVVITPRG